MIKKTTKAGSAAKKTESRSSTRTYRSRPGQASRRTTATRSTSASSSTRTRSTTRAPRPGDAPRGNAKPQRVAKRSGRSRQTQKRTSRRAPVKVAKKKDLPIPKIEDGVIRIVPLGGVEQVGQNMTAIEYGDTIIVVDAGIEFSDSDTPGIDFIIPNTTYLEDNKDKVKAMFITHGHLDHIGAMPFVLPKIGNPMVYTREFGAMMIKKRHEEFPHLPKLNLTVLDGDETTRIDENITVESYPISHTIPDAMGLLINTPLGEIAFIEDVRVDNVNGIPTEEEFEQYKRFKDRDILLLTLDSTGAHKPGFSISENSIIDNLESIIRDTKNGRLIVGTFASQVERIVGIIQFAQKHKKKVVVEGRSMKTNVEIARQLGLFDAKNLISLGEMADYPPNKIVMLATGAQGEEFAALNRMANKTHKHIKLTSSDTVLLSSSIIPGNESAIAKLKDNLYRSDARVITYLDADVHASGHGNRGELAWIHNQIEYRYFMPVHGHHYMLKQHGELATELGAKKEHVIVPDNGSIIEIYDGGKKIRKRKERAPYAMSTVDGTSIGTSQELVIRDRKLLSQDGMFVVVVALDLKTKKVKKSPDIISRGFVHLRESQNLLSEARRLIAKTVESAAKKTRQADFDIIKKNISDSVSKLLLKKTGKRPIIIPVVLSF